MSHQFVYPTTGGELEHPFGPGADPTPWLEMDPVQRRRRGLEVYEFDADPVGLHLYHCHSLPLKRHIHKGLYGTFIVDPVGGRPKIDPDTNEPLPADHPLWQMPNVLITPHVAACSPRIAERHLAVLLDNLGRFVRGEELSNVADKAKWF